ncbi:unnamed protein product [Urochloa decumbens]|uniref:Carotenoid cleavage dioxygenase 8 n=1 Tax=Urochloa decumbens TaxID=240449 RepID=A0ABC8WGR9_9POAL
MLAPLRNSLTARATTPETGRFGGSVRGGAADGAVSAWKSIRRERWEGALELEGTLPHWLDGTYLRNGPGVWDLGGHGFRHLFDGYATLVRVAFRDGRAAGAHRQVESDAYRAARAHGRVRHREFSEAPEPCALLSRLLGRRLAGRLAFLCCAPITDNANTGVLALGDGRVLCTSEAVSSWTLVDPDTLSTVGKFRYGDRLGGLVHSAHPVVVPRSGSSESESELWTLVPDLLRRGYLVVRMEAGTDERAVVGRVRCRGRSGVGWVHSFPVTEHYVVVPEMPLKYSARSIFRAEPTPLYRFDWRPEGGSYMHVVCKASGNTVASVEVPPFVTFHYINAYEERDADGRTTAVVVDCCEHEDTSILDSLRLDSLRSLAGLDVLPDARVGRFRIPLDGSPAGELEEALDPEEHGRAMDMCSINPAYRGKPYRYAYACGARRPCNFPNTLTKVDLVERKATAWHEEGMVPSEPLFVARPGATREDDGVVISLVSGKGGSGYAVVLDGTTFQEVARAKFPYGLPFGLHGCWIPRT